MLYVYSTFVYPPTLPPKLHTFSRPLELIQAKGNFEKSPKNRIEFEIRYLMSVMKIIDRYHHAIIKFAS